MLRNFRLFHIWVEILIRIALVATFFKLETVAPFKRKILPDEIWIYRLVDKLIMQTIALTTKLY